MLCLVWNILVAILALSDSFVFGQNHLSISAGPAFFDARPSWITERKSLRDCSRRYYSGIDDSNRPVSGLGGVRAYRGEFQHMVAIGWTRDGQKIDYLCGGSLITPNFVLTAAHCVVDSENIAPDTVRIGDTDLGSPEDDEYAQQIAIVRFTTHPQYRGSRKYFDIALIELAASVRFSEAVCIACLWRDEHVPTSEVMDAVGFGATGFAEALSPTLQRVQLKSVDRSDCVGRVTVSRRQMPEGFRDDQFCAASDTMDTCEGDSGGPLGVKRYDVGGTVIPLIVGVVSFGAPCSIGSTGVYTRVGAFADWIEQVTNRSLGYAECTRGSFCIGRVRQDIPVNFDRSFAQNRFGLLWDSDSSSMYECGATLIDEQYLMTLASCVTSNRGYPKYVAYTPEERVVVTDVYVSPMYRSGSPENDIALLKIAKFANTAVYRPACLWDRRIDGEWTGNPQFSAYGPNVVAFDPVLQLANNTIVVSGKEEKRCDKTGTNDIVCYRNTVNLVPGVCSMDYGASVTNGSYWGEPEFAFGMVSKLSKDCGSDLFVHDVTPHINWIESIVVNKRDQYLVFSD